MERKHEITILAETNSGLMALVDRITLTATDTKDAAGQLARLYHRSTGLPHREFAEPVAGVTLTRTQLETWAGRPLTDADLAHLGEIIPNSTIPEAVGLIVAGGKEFSPYHDSEEGQ